MNIPRLNEEMEKLILNKNVRMDAQVAFNMNGDIHIYPEPWEMEQTPVMQPARTSYRGRITMMDDGQTEVKRYNIGSQLPVYRKMFSTEHCDVMCTVGGKLIERWKFGKKLTFHQIWDIRRREQPSVDAFFLSMKEDLA